MKTRRKVGKSPAKGKRPVLSGVKKSPVLRKNIRRGAKTFSANARLAVYDSPLSHLHRNCTETSSSSSPVKNEPPEDEISKNENMVAKELSCAQPLSTTINKVEPKEEEIICDDSREATTSASTNNCTDGTNKGPAESNTASKRKKKGIFTAILDREITQPHKKRKIKKSPLSKFNEIDDTDGVNLSDSVILLDDTLLESEAAEKISLDNLRLAGSLTNNDDVVVISGNDTLEEMEAYHQKFNEETNVAPDNLLDSVIVLDADEEACEPTWNQASTSTATSTSMGTGTSTANLSTKSNEDCIFVWSSEPKPGPSKTNHSQISNNPRSWVDNNRDILKCNKIFIDTKADNRNLKFLNSENSKPSKMKVFKSPKAIIKSPVKKTLTKTTLNKSKALTSVAAYTAAKVARTTNKATTAANKKNKNDGGLIFGATKDDSTSATKATKSKKGKLREIVIDGSNCAMAYTHNKVFSEKGIKLLIDYFKKKGHSVKVFVPQHKRSRNHPLLEKWYEEGIVVFTPSRKLAGKSITSYDDRYILEYATTCDGIVVSQDQFRDLYAEKPLYRETIEKRILVPTFVGDYVMFPEDPLGRNGPCLTDFLKH